MKFAKSALTLSKKTIFAVVALLGFASSVATLSLSDPFKNTARFWSTAGLNETGSVLAIAFMNKSDHPMTNAQITFGVIDGNRNPLLFEERYNGYTFARPYPLYLAARGTASVTVTEEHARNLAQTESLVVCAKYDGRYWFHNLSESLLLTRKDAEFTPTSISQKWSFWGYPLCDGYDDWW